MPAEADKFVVSLYSLDGEPRITIIKTSELAHARLHFGTKGTLLLGDQMPTRT